MEKEYKGTLFKLMMTLSFLTGAIAFFFALMYVPEPLCKVGFGVLMLFSLLCAVGINAADASAAILLMKDKGLAAVITVIAACVLSVISSSVLVRRYMEDDF